MKPVVYTRSVSNEPYDLAISQDRQQEMVLSNKEPGLPDSAALHLNFHNERSRMPHEMLRACSLSLIAFQHLHNRGKCIPIARSDRYSEDVVDRAEVSNGFHLAAVHTENKFVVCCEDF